VEDKEMVAHSCSFIDNYSRLLDTYCQYFASSSVYLSVCLEKIISYDFIEKSRRKKIMGSNQKNK
jgi:hypothetical protein